MALCKKDVTPLLMHWSYIFLALTHRVNTTGNSMTLFFFFFSFCLKLHHCDKEKRNHVVLLRYWGLFALSHSWHHDWIHLLCEHAIRGPFYWHGLTLIPAWISNHIHYKMWNEITSPFPIFNGATVEVWEWRSNFIPHFTGHMCLFIPAGIKVNPC